MNSNPIYTIHHTFPQSVVDAFKKIVSEGYLLRTVYCLTTSLFTDLEFFNFVKPYQRANWKWTKVDAKKVVLYFDTFNRDQGILLTISHPEQSLVLPIPYTDELRFSRITKPSGAFSVACVQGKK